VFVEDGRGGRVKRTATWRWEESEWKVLLRKDGGGTSRIEKPLPSISVKENSPSRLQKAAGKTRENGEGASGSVGTDTRENPKVETVTDDSDEPTTEEPFTDADGWVFSGNKWEAPSSKGAMSKFTRYRRWTRIALVSELVEVVEATGGVSIQRSPSVGSRSTDTDVFSPTSATNESIWSEGHEPEGSVMGSPPASLRHRALTSIVG
jgi:hypothetical protein